MFIVVEVKNAEDKEDEFKIVNFNNVDYISLENGYLTLTLSNEVKIATLEDMESIARLIQSKEERFYD